MYNGVVIQGISVLEIVKTIARDNKRYQATTLGQVEELLGRDSEEFKQIRKLILDGSNEFTRGVIQSIFGDIDV